MFLLHSLHLHPSSQYVAANHIIVINVVGQKHNLPNIHSLHSNSHQLCTTYISHHYHLNLVVFFTLTRSLSGDPSGMTSHTKFQTAVDPPPLIFRKSCCRFFLEFMTEVPFKMAKICNINVWIGNDPMIHFGTRCHPLAQIS